MAPMTSKVGSDQHYVPRFLFAPWAVMTAKGPDRVWVYDRRWHRIYDRSPGGILYERGFYDSSATESADGLLSTIETEVAPVLQAIRATRSISCLSPRAQVGLAVFAATQYLRSPRIRVSLEQLADGQLTNTDGEPLLLGAEWFQRLGFSPRQLHHQWITNFQTVADIFLSKVWMLVSDASSELVVSDHPLVAWDAREEIRTVPREKQDWRAALEASFLYLPIAPNLMLHLCPRSACASVQQFRCEGIRSQLFPGTATFDRHAVNRANWGQAYRCVRYIISRSGDFTWLGENTDIGKDWLGRMEPVTDGC